MTRRLDQRRVQVRPREAAGSHRGESLRSIVDAAVDPLDIAPALTDAQFRFFGALAYEHAGIVIADFKRSMVLRRISRRVKSLDLASIDEYCRLLTGPAGAGEIEHLINVLTTNKTAFFRDAHHFDHLRGVALPQIAAEKRARHSTRIRIWSAGCSTGEEAWSIAIAASEALAGLAPFAGTWDLKILATDIDSEVAAVAKQAKYARSDLVPLPTEMQQKYFMKPRDGTDELEVSQELRRFVVVKRLNLHDAWPFAGPFDAIFCRNVVIYFDRDAQRLLFDRFASILPVGGLLYCGHSESILSLSDRFRPAGRSVYERVA